MLLFVSKANFSVLEHYFYLIIIFHLIEALPENIIF